MNERPLSPLSAARGAPTAPDGTAAALARIEASLTRLEARLDALESQTLATVGIAVDTFDRTVANARTRGIDVDERLRTALRLVERLTEPTVARSLEQALDLVPQLPALVATATDTFDGAVARLRAAGIDLDERGGMLLRAAERLTSPEALRLLCMVLDRLETLRSLLESGVLDPQATRVVGTAGAALAQTATEPMTPGPGAFGALLALGDGDVRTTVGFALRFARNLGRALKNASGALPARTEG